MPRPRQSLSPVHSLFGRSLHEQGRSLAAWGVGLGLYCAAMLAIFPTVRGNESIAKLLDAYPQAVRSMFSLADYTTGPGFLRGELFSLAGPLLLVILAVLWGSDTIAGEEERGTIDLLLANPISRSRVVVEKWAALVAGVALVSSVFVLVLGACGPLVDLHVPLVDLLATVVSAALLAVLFGTVSLAVASATGRRGLARGTSAGLVVAAYLVSSLASLVGWLRPVQPLSPWYHAIGVDPLSGGFSWHALVLVGLVLVLLSLAVVTFERRDLAVS